MKRVAIFASGRGSNAQKIIEYFEDKPEVQISLIITNKATAAVLQLADAHQIPRIVIERKTFYDTEQYLMLLQEKEIDLLVLAGFLWLIPAYLVRNFPNRIINIHPALLPKYGGKGMYGSYVHQAVWEAKEDISGITIHYVNETYDEGGIIFQTSCVLLPSDKPKDIARKVLALEHHHFPRVIEKVLVQQHEKL